MTMTDTNREALRDAVAEYERLRDHVGGCTDGGCVVKRPAGMHTNGGCKCPRNPITAQRMMYAGQRLHAAIAALSRPEPAGEWFPLLGTPFAIRRNMLNEETAQRLHGQSLNRLAQRGGLDPGEAWNNVKQNQRYVRREYREAFAELLIAARIGSATK